MIWSSSELLLSVSLSISVCLSGSGSGDCLWLKTASDFPVFPFQVGFQGGMGCAEEAAELGER